MTNIAERNQRASILVIGMLFSISLSATGMDQGALESFLTRHTCVGQLGSGERELTVLVLSADYNRNEIVDTADYTLWQDSIGEFVLPATGADGNGDGIIDQADYAFWKERFGTVVNGTGTASSERI